jgi:tetratricopeptide (TPR) repeat protein
MLYCLLTGRPPFQSANKYDIIMQVIECDPISPRRMDPKIDRDLETICLKCLAKDPADRYRSAHELEADLGRFLNDQPILARPPGVWESAQQWARNNAVTVTTLVMILASSAIVLPLLAVALRNQAGRAVSAAEGIQPVKSVTESEVSQARAVVREMTRQLATEPGNPALLGERARALITSGDDLAAIKDLDTLIDGNGAVSEWRQLRAEIALRAGRLQDAIADLTSVLEHQPDHFASLAERAQARLDAAFLVGALDDVNLALRLRPGTARLFLLRAKIQARLGDRASARRDRERARTLGLEKEG